MAQRLEELEPADRRRGVRRQDRRDKIAASLDRANRVRDQLVRNGVDPNRSSRSARASRRARAGGVRVVEAPPPPEARRPPQTAKAGDTPRGAADAEPIGTSHFESTPAMTVAKGTSAMVSILDAETERRGRLPLRSRRARAATRSSPSRRCASRTRPTRARERSGQRLRRRPVHRRRPRRADPGAFHRVRPVRARSPDRRRAEGRRARRHRAHHHGAARRLLDRSPAHRRRRRSRSHNRMAEQATVYVRHTVAEGYKLKNEKDAKLERIGAAHLFRVEVPPSGTAELVIEEATPALQDRRPPLPRGHGPGAGLPLGRRRRGPARRRRSRSSSRSSRTSATSSSRSSTMREQMKAYRVRMDELHAQIVTLRS